MQEVIDFLKAKNVEKTKFFNQLKCSLEEAKILQYLSKRVYKWKRCTKYN